MLSQVVTIKFSHTTVHFRSPCYARSLLKGQSDVIVRNLRNDFISFVPKEHSFDWFDEVALLRIKKASRDNFTALTQNIEIIEIEFSDKIYKYKLRASLTTYRIMKRCLPHRCSEEDLKTLPQRPYL